MKIFAIGDLHLGHSVDKPMDIFGPHWKNHTDRIAENWRRTLGDEDLGLVPGDLSWAMRMEQAEADLRWLERLPGRKVVIKGNHDYWWPSISRLRARFQGRSVYPLQYDSVCLEGVVVGGTRLWNIPEIEASYTDPLRKEEEVLEPVLSTPDPPEKEKAREEKLFRRELGRLEHSLLTMEQGADLRIAMTHFPPTDETGRETPVTRMLERFKIDICVFGHLHSLSLPGGKTWDLTRKGVRYVLVSCDAVGFSPYYLVER